MKNQSEMACISVRPPTSTSDATVLPMESCIIQDCDDTADMVSTAHGFRRFKSKDVLGSSFTYSGHYT